MTSIEYSLIAAIMSVAIIAGLNTVKTKMESELCSMTNGKVCFVEMERK